MTDRQTDTQRYEYGTNMVSSDERNPPKEGEKNSFQRKFRTKDVSKTGVLFIKKSKECGLEHSTSTV